VGLCSHRWFFWGVTRMAMERMGGLRMRKDEMR
jgi:hypothetical protein